MRPPIPSAFPEQIREGLQPWQAKKLYMDNVRSNEDWTIKLETSQKDPLLGETYVQFAWKGLQHQLSQGAGSWHFNSEGPRYSYYKLIDSASRKTLAAGTHENDFFDGIDTSLPGLAARLGADESKVPWLRPQLQAIAKTVDDATAAADKDPQSAGAPLLRGLSLTRALIAKVNASALTGAEKADLLASLAHEGTSIRSRPRIWPLVNRASAWPGYARRPSDGGRVSDRRRQRARRRSSRRESRFCCGPRCTMAARSDGREAVCAGRPAGLEVRAVHGQAAEDRSLRAMAVR